ncbi:MAG: hypothetical protein ACI9RL_000065 [Candidatus Paceibacteria bacterium]|jgi:hypothetical protein
MKTTYLVLSAILLIFIIAQFFIHRNSTNIEMYPYTIDKKLGDVEIRTYKARLFTSVPITANSYRKASSAGFSKLGGYIFGANESNQKIAMTSPVSMSLGEESSMQFMVPKAIKKEALPKPNQADITFKEMPSKRMAVITFGGWVHDEKIDKYKKQLMELLEEKEISYSRNFYLFGYNPPYDIFFRKNEVAVELAE